jgi:hypothetical protein
MSLYLAWSVRRWRSWLPSAIVCGLLLALLLSTSWIVGGISADLSGRRGGVLVSLGRAGQSGVTPLTAYDATVLAASLEGFSVLETCQYSVRACFDVETGQRSLRIAGGFSTGNLGEVIGAELVLGEFGPVDPTGAPRLWVTRAAWLSLFAGDSAVLGKLVTIAYGTNVKRVLNLPVTAVFEVPERYRALVPAVVVAGAVSPDIHDVGPKYLGLAAGPVAPIADRLRVIADESFQAHPIPGLRSGYEFRAQPVAKFTLEQREVVRLVLVLLVALVGVAGGAYAVAVQAAFLRRSADLSVCAALGASRRGMWLPTVTEVCIAAICSASFGVIGSFVLTRAAWSALPATWAASAQSNPGVAFTVAALAAGGSLVPAVVLSFRLSPSALRSAGARSGVLSGAVVIVLAALAAGSTSVFIGMLRPLAQGNRYEQLVDADSALTTRVMVLPRDRQSTPALNRVFEDLWTDFSDSRSQARIASISGLPGVDPPQTQSLGLRGQELIDVPTFYIHGDFFELMGIRMVRGEDFSQFGGGHQKVCVVSRTASQRYWPDADPIGEAISLGRDDRARIVGIVEDIPSAMTDGDQAAVYLQARHHTFTAFRVLVAPRATGTPTQGLLDAVRPGIPMEPAVTLSAAWAPRMRAQRDLVIAALLASCTAVVSLVAVVVGVVQTRVAFARRSVLVRSALGARPWQLFMWLVRRDTMLVAAGAGVAFVMLPATNAVGRWASAAFESPSWSWQGAIVVAVAGIALMVSTVTAFGETRPDTSLLVRSAS